MVLFALTSIYPIFYNYIIFIKIEGGNMEMDGKLHHINLFLSHQE